MSDEFTALVWNGTWELVPSRPNQNLVGCKWVFRIKCHPDGSIDRYKAHLVAKRFHQCPSIDFYETFSQVVKPTTIRVILQLALTRGWPIRQLDVNNAFLHGTLHEEVFMSQPPGFVDFAFPSHVCKLRKAFHGHKQAPRAWYKELISFLVSYGFHHSKSNAFIFVSHHRSIVAYFLVYVNDLIVTCSGRLFITKFLDTLAQRFSLKDLGAKDVSMPLFTTTALVFNGGATAIDATPFRSLIGGLQYLSLTRPDIAFAHHTLSLHALSDANWAGNPNNHTSTTAYTIFLGGNLISWSSRKQHSVARSSTEAEYRVVACTAAELSWLQNLLRELGATFFCANPVLHSHMKHIAIDLHFVRDLVAQGLLKVAHVSTIDQLVDALTKPLSYQRFHLLRSKIGVTDGGSILRGCIREAVQASRGIADYYCLLASGGRYEVTATAPGYKSKTTGIWLDKAGTNVDFVLDPNVNRGGIPLRSACECRWGTRSVIWDTYLEAFDCCCGIPFVFMQEDIQPIKTEAVGVRK
ncbi:hypothetical protein L3X38_041669 [Prunus dulcis]|uniref:Reverse transcriptase Ty1/copia-type domain-containing protein n=1 Tax=Prunus dulcis TaxID=3755 RepID=A0AAD4UV59_PRUDU|nr:hypothetical protein L3X38_041669 [Prunus dulcis]